MKTDTFWWLMAVAAAVAVITILRRRRRQTAADRAATDELLERARERQAKKRSETSGPVTGKKCIGCEKRIVVDFDGLRCDECGAPAHHACIKAHRGEAHTIAAGAYR